MKLVTLALAALALAGCAATPTTASSSTRTTLEEKEYRTGSRIPVREPVNTSSSNTRDPSTLSTGMPPRTN